jgi:hypothetical protein
MGDQSIPRIYSSLITHHPSQVLQTAHPLLAEIMISHTALGGTALIALKDDFSTRTTPPYKWAFRPTSC